MGSAKKKVTFSLHEDVIGLLDSAMSSGLEASKNVFVERAIRNECRQVHRREQERQWRMAMNDRKFLEDLQDAEEGFSTADAEATRGIE